MDSLYSDRRHTLYHLLIIVAVCALARLLMAVVFPLLIAPDSAGYIDVARMISQRDFSGYDGSRTPMYPLLISAAGLMTSRVMLIQHMMGILTAVCVYFIFLRITDRRNLALIAALVAGLNPGIIVLERAILTESLTTLLLITTMAVFLSALESHSGRLAWLGVAGILSGLAVLARPALIYLPVLLGMLVLWSDRRESRTVIFRNVTAVVLPGVLLVLMWSGFNYRCTGFFTPSTLGGFVMMNHTGAFIEDAPPEYDRIKQVYLAHRARQVAAFGHQRMTVCLAKQDMMENTGMDFPELSNTLKKLSFALILKHPLKYGASVGLAFARFWRAAWYTNQGGFSEALANGSIPMILLIIVFLLSHTFLTLIFLALPAVWWLWSGFRADLELNSGWLALYGFVLAGAVLQALIVVGENPRYGIPYEPLILPAGAIALVVFYQVIINKPIRGDA